MLFGSECGGCLFCCLTPVALNLTKVMLHSVTPKLQFHWNPMRTSCVCNTASGWFGHCRSITFSPGTPPVRTEPMPFSPERRPPLPPPTSPEDHFSGIQKPSTVHGSSARFPPKQSFSNHPVLVSSSAAVSVASVLSPGVWVLPFFRVLLADRKWDWYWLEAFAHSPCCSTIICMLGQARMRYNFKPVFICSLEQVQ